MAYFTEEEALNAVKMNGRSLDRVPHEFRSEELCQAAVTQSGSSLEFVPRVWKEEPLCLLEVQKKSLRTDVGADRVKDVSHMHCSCEQ